MAILTPADDPFRSRNDLDPLLSSPDPPSTGCISPDDSLLLIRLGGIGDSLRLISPVEFLRQTDWSGELGVAVEPPVDELFEQYPRIDDVHSFAIRHGRFQSNALHSALQNVRSKQYDWVLDCHGIFKSGVLAGGSGAKYRVGYHSDNTKELNWLFSQHRIQKLSSTLPRTLKYVQLVRSLFDDVQFDRDDLRPVWPTKVPENESLHQAAQQQPYLLHPVTSSGRYGNRKNWGDENFRSLLTELQSEMNAPFLITWGPGEREAARTIADAFDRSVQVAPSTKSFSDLLYLIQKSRLFIGVDAGPTHLADQTGTPCAIIYGVDKVTQNAPLFTPYRAITREDGETRTRDIPVSRVYNAVVDLMSSI